MKIISAGGVGGCDITQAIQRIFTELPRYPYDWFLTNQSFIIRTISKIDTKQFIDFSDKTKIHGNEVHVDELDVLSVHDLPDSYDEEIIQKIKDKYQRRLERLTDALVSDEPILFVRLANNTETSPNWKNRFHSVRDDFSKWVEFIKYLNMYYKKPIYLLVITMNEKEYEENQMFECDNVMIRFFDDSVIEDTDLHHYLLSNLIRDIYTSL